MLIESEKIHRFAYTQTIKECVLEHLPNIFYSQLNHCFRRSENEAAACISNLLRKYGHPVNAEDLLTKKTALTIHLMTETQKDIVIPFAEQLVIACLNYMKNPLGLYSGSLRKIWTVLTSKKQFFSNFKSTIFSEDLIRLGLKGKPAKDGYTFIMKDIKAQPQRCVIFEDSVQGVLAGVSASAKVIIVRIDSHNISQFYDELISKLPSKITSHIYINTSWELVLN